MLKKIIFLLVIIIILLCCYFYIYPHFFKSDEIVIIEGNDAPYKFLPDNKEGDSFNGESLEIYEITREKLLPNNENQLIENNTEQLSVNINEENNISNDNLEFANSLYLQLGSFKTTQKAEQYIKSFKKINSELITDFNFNISSADLNERGTFYRVRLGPFIDNKKIFGLCVDLKLLNNECLIVKGK